MQEELMQNEVVAATDENQEMSSRRAFFGRVAALGMGAAALTMLGSTEIAQALPPATASNQAQFRRRLLAMGTVSLLTSQVALSKATNSEVRRFAQFEAAEQTAVGQVLKEMGTVPPPMDAQDRALLDRMRSLPRGDRFDREYSTAQYRTHLALRDLCNNYLRNSAPRRNNMREMHVRHLAMMALPAITEHISHSLRLSRSEDL